MATTADSTSSEKATPALCSASSSGSTGPRKREKAVPCEDGMPTARPAITVMIASTISGTVMDAGDSWMWCRVTMNPGCGYCCR